MLKGSALVETSQEEKIFDKPSHLGAGDSDAVYGLITLVATS
jgi:hypothetical protein